MEAQLDQVGQVVGADGVDARPRGVGVGQFAEAPEQLHALVARPPARPSAIQERPRTPNIRKLSPLSENRKRLSPSRARLASGGGVLGLGQDGAHAVEVGIVLADHRRRRRGGDQPPDAEAQQQHARAAPARSARAASASDSISVLGSNSTRQIWASE